MTKKIILRIFVVSVCFAGCQSLSAQTEDALLLQLSKSEGESSSISGVNVLQNGVNNDAYILQVTNVTTSGVQATQKGNENAIQLIQAGEYIDIKVSQNGNENSYEADIKGKDARIDISQSGSENMIYQSLMLNSTGISIIQNGANNEVIHTGTSNNSGIQIQQQGSGMKVIIQTN
jgi:hypothetical protein